MNSVGGGTGSGFGSRIYEKLSEEYNKKDKLGFIIYPSAKAQTAIIEPYNAVLATKTLREHVNSIIVLDNEALFDICKEKLKIARPTHTTTNHLTAQFIATLTTSLRFNGALFHDFTDFA